MSDLPTHVLIGAARRQAEAAGASCTIRRRGNDDRGTILLKVDDRLAGARLYRQIWDGTQRRLAEALPGADDAALEAAIARETAWDPDAWVVEIEDRHGRLFFDTIFAANDEGE